MTRSQPRNGSQWTFARWHCLVPLAACCAVLTSQPALAADSCDTWSAEFVLISGRVEILPDGTAEWRPAEPGGRACRGDVVRSGPFATAGLRLPDKTIFRLDQNTQVQMPEPPEEDSGTLIRLLRGIIHIISRDPRELTFATPQMNAGLEGTEFVIAVDADSADVTVLEGIVAVDSGGSEVEVLPGERSSSTAGQPTDVAPVADPFAATRWTPWSAQVLLADAAPDAGAVSADDFVRRAAGRIRHGGFDAAAADLARAEQLDASHPGIPTLRTMIALSRGEREQALSFSTQAIAADATYAPAELARSYAAQAWFDYPGALEHAGAAARLAPSSAVAIARLAEIELATGAGRDAAADATRAIALDPAAAHAYMVLGYARLDDGDLDAAVTNFATAARLDPGSPLPRIGQGFALLRRGETVAGRDQLELAVILDPTNAAVRSVMAKTYAQEGRLELARAQLDLAAMLDAADPTTELYRALIEEWQNRHVAALEAYERAVALNDDEATFRTELRVDRDTAVRDFGFGRLYRNLGFDDWALRRGWRATSMNPTDHSGHQLLSDAYAHLPRYDLSRVSEHYQARLLQPLTQSPIIPELGEPSLYLTDDLGPGQLATSELRRLVPRNGPRLQASAITAGADTRAYDVAVTQLGNHVAYGGGHFDFSTDGFRPNNDQRQQLTTGFVQFQPNSQANYLAELRHSESDQGDLTLRFDRDSYIPGLRQTESIDAIRLGMRRELGSGILLLSGNVTTNSNDVTSGPFYSSATDLDSTSFEAQHLLNAGRWELTTGVYGLHQVDRTDDTYILDPTAPAPIVVSSKQDSKELSAYAYGRFDATERLSVLLGLSANRTRLVNGPTTRQLDPKLGLQFDVGERTTLRASHAEYTRGRLIARRAYIPRLEPTHVFGFNQIFSGGSNGEQATRNGVAIEHRLGDRLLAGVELSQRTVAYETQILVLGSEYGPDVVRGSEDSSQAFVHWIVNDRLSLGAAYRRDDFTVDSQSLPQGFTRLDTRSAPLELNFFTRSGLHFNTRYTQIRQNGLFVNTNNYPNIAVDPDGDNFGILDLGLSFDLPRQRGLLALSIDNALDKHFSYQAFDLDNPNLIMERVVALRITISQ